MHTANGSIILEDAQTIAPPSGDWIAYTDASGMKIMVPVRLLIRLESIARFECEKRGNNWEAECARIMEGA